MGDLDNVLRAMKANPDAGDLVAQLQGVIGEMRQAAGIETLRREVEKLRREVRKINRVEQEVDSIQKGLQGRFERLERGVSKTYEASQIDWGPLQEDIGELGKEVGKYLEAINGIKLPEVNIPEFPSFPDIPETDLAPVLAAIREVAEKLDTREEPVAADPPSYEFDITYAQGGAIRKVVANPVR